VHQIGDQPRLYYDARSTNHQALRVSEGSGSQISKQSGHEGDKVVNPTHWPPLPPKKYFWYLFLLESESTPGPYCGRKDYINENV
jgi:hypothetical protein